MISAGTNERLMLVSATVGTDLRAAVARRARPCPEFLALERDHGVKLLDWSALGPGEHQRSVPLAARHAARALLGARRARVVFSDGEHVGAPLAVAMGMARVRTPHLMLGHRLLQPAKARVLRAALSVGRPDRIVVHTRRQAELVPAALGVKRSSVHRVPYGVDTGYWMPTGEFEEEDLVFAAGREHRDYRTLAAACAAEPVRVVITGASAHSPAARQRTAEQWPANLSRVSLSFEELRRAYDRAAVVVVPLMATDFPAGTTGVLEAMAMGRAVVASATDDMRELIEHRRTGVLVEPGDPLALRTAIRELLADAAGRRDLGAAARRAVVERFSLSTYVAHLGDHLAQLSGSA